MFKQAFIQRFRVDVLAVRCLGAAGGTARILDRELVPRLGYSGMLTLTLLVFALLQALMPAWSFFGGASLPVLWCAIVYYVLRFRIRRGLMAAGAGSLLSCLAYDAPMLATGATTLVLSLCFLFLGRWLYTEFVAAHMLAGGLFALLAPVSAWLLGVPVVYSGPAMFIGTVVLALPAAVVVFRSMEWTRRQLNVDVSFAEESDIDTPASSERIQRPFFAPGTGV